MTHFGTLAALLRQFESSTRMQTVYSRLLPKTDSVHCLNFWRLSVLDLVKQTFSVLPSLLLIIPWDMTSLSLTSCCGGIMMLMIGRWPDIIWTSLEQRAVMAFMQTETSKKLTNRLNWKRHDPANGCRAHWHQIMVQVQVLLVSKCRSFLKVREILLDIFVYIARLICSHRHWQMQAVAVQVGSKVYICRLRWIIVLMIAGHTSSLTKPVIRSPHSFAASLQVWLCTYTTFGQMNWL